MDDTTSSRPRVIVDTNFRALHDVFTPADLARLQSLTDVVWGSDERMPDDDFLREIADADAVVFGHWRRPVETLDHAGPRLRALLEVAGGHEHALLPYDAALERGVHVGSCAPAFAAVVAEFGLGLALTMTRGIASASAAMRDRKESWLHEGNETNRTLFGATIGLVGVGGIARQLIDMMAPFDVRFLGYDPPLGADAMNDLGVEPAALDRIFDEADLVYVVAAPTPGSDALVDRSLLERLEPHQSLVLLSRASLVDWDALLDCSLRNGFRFATDVYPTEPIADDDPVRDHPNAILTPHLAGAFDQALHTIGAMVVDDLEALFAGETPNRMQYLTPANQAGLLQAPKASGWTEHHHDTEG